jgi:hypothetical protein
MRALKGVLYVLLAVGAAALVAYLALSVTGCQWFHEHTTAQEVCIARLRGACDGADPVNVSAAGECECEGTCPTGEVAIGCDDPPGDDEAGP